MLKATAIASGLAAAFYWGYQTGKLDENKRVTNRLKGSAPLLSRAITSVAKRVIEDDLTQEEACRLMDMELEFITIAMQPLNR